MFDFLTHMAPVNAAERRELSIEYTVMLRTGTMLHFVPSGISQHGEARVCFTLRLGRLL